MHRNSSLPSCGVGSVEFSLDKEPYFDIQLSRRERFCKLSPIVRSNPGGRERRCDSSSEGALTCVFGLRPIDETLDVRGLAGLVLSSAITFAVAQQR